MQSATLNMTLTDYQELLNARKRAEQEAADVRAELAAAKLVDPTGVVTGLNAFARDCLTIAQYAVANLPPELNKGWPYEALLRICENIDILPDYTVNDRDMALDVINFARDCEAHEIRRRSAPKPTRMTAEEIAEKRAQLEKDPVAKSLMDRMKQEPPPGV
jgi:hypothetical protein